MAQREVLSASRAGFAPAARFSRQLLALRLRSVPLALPQLTTVIYLALWEDEADLVRFRRTALARWIAATEHLSLNAVPVGSFGSWRGVDPLAGLRSEPDPARPALLLTHSRTRVRSMPSFLFADRPVVGSLSGAEGHLWADGFIDRIRSLDSGTLSLWRSMDDALGFAYRPGAHQAAVAAEKERGWFEESWFARFSVIEAAGQWRGLSADSLN